jgi:starch synthase
VQLDFTDRLEHRLMAGADLFLMPSLYEPCGLTQMRAQRYGALPIARRVGGLADTIEDEVTGFLFDAYTPDTFEEAAFRALARFGDAPRWQAMMREAMGRDFSWERTTDRYRAVYERAVAIAEAGA